MNRNPPNEDKVNTDHRKYSSLLTKYQVLFVHNNTTKKDYIYDPSTNIKLRENELTAW